MEFKILYAPTSLQISAKNEFCQQPFCTPQCNTQLTCGVSFLNHPATSPTPFLLYPSARGEQCIEVNWSLLSPCWWAAKIGKHIPNNIKLGLQKSLEVLSGWYETSLVSCQESCVHHRTICLIKLTSLI